ncbi:hypothetical protein [Anabaena azotica]|uniref:tRNA nuclease CdiA C-terminal domain-containing protein n=1 Tax=Anabaena azotica FACHB-119 TaxID=947527 RepID=A0ABR8D0E0_9NOST|nr:hypothetical protein [Anabaena azotica]MBD2499858.1 hypothetical protein [Anabaena azotica FACHB-119]
MAGDLLIVSIESEDLTLLREALKGDFQQEIHHSNRDTQDAWNLLNDRLKQTQGPANRKGLPPHMYISFIQIDSKVITDIQKGKLSNLMMKITRPLGVISVKQDLDAWETTQQGRDRLDLLIKATQKQKIIIEFYKVGGVHVLQKYPNATKIPERI